VHAHRFTHGVLNTDNMSLVGATIDYGPYGFMEHFDPDFVPNGSDGTGRYRYSDQPDVSNIAHLT
jgi:serine/tyrosine/threonine adenylyltransferase